MSTQMDPKQVEKPFWKRWMRMTWNLFVRSPMRFGSLIALLGLLDTSALRLAYGFVVPRIWTDRLGMLLIPLIFAVVSAVARGADDNRQTWIALRECTRLRLLIKALAAGVVLLAFNIGIHALLLFSDPSAKVAFTQHSGVLLESLAAQTCLVLQILGICYSPLLVFAPALSFRETRKLSQSASILNNQWQIAKLFIGVLCIGMLLEPLPACGLPQAALLVFIGTLSYVAYRDIFERRDVNLPVNASAATVSGGILLPEK